MCILGVFFFFVFQVQFRSPVVDAIVLQIMVWSRIRFEQISHTSPAACRRPIGSRGHICFCPLQSQLLFSSSLSPNRCLSVGCKATSLLFPQFHRYSCSPQQPPQGATDLGGRGAPLLAYSNWNHTPISFLTVLQSYLCVQIIQYPHTQHLQVTRLSANHICRF